MQMSHRRIDVRRGDDLKGLRGILGQRVLPQLDNLEQLRRMIERMGRIKPEHFPELKGLLDKILADKEKPGEVVSTVTYDRRILRCGGYKIPADFLSVSVNLPAKKPIRGQRVPKRTVRHIVEDRPFLVFVPRGEIEPNIDGKLDGQWVVLVGIRKRFDERGKSDAFEVHY